MTLNYFLVEKLKPILRWKPQEQINLLMEEMKNILMDCRVESERKWKSQINEDEECKKRLGVFIGPTKIFVKITKNYYPKWQFIVKIEVK